MTCLILLCTTLVSKVIIALSAHLLVDILRSLAVVQGSQQQQQQQQQAASAAAAAATTTT